MKKPLHKFLIICRNYESHKDCSRHVPMYAIRLEDNMSICNTIYMQKELQ